jgi:hypothetical protein
MTEHEREFKLQHSRYEHIGCQLRTRRRTSFGTRGRRPLSRCSHQCVISHLKSFGREEESIREVDGATLIARSLKQQGINHLFVGFPVTPIAAAAQAYGLRGRPRSGPCSSGVSDESPVTSSHPQVCGR